VSSLVTERPGTGRLVRTAPPSVRPVMLLTLNVPFDPAAVEFALESAAETGAELYVCDGVPINTSNPAAAASRTFGTPETQANARAVAHDASLRGINVTQLVFHHPRPVSAALEVTRDEHVGLLVFGPDRARIGRWSFRRAARCLRRGAPCLVWTNE
jgi:universal stress protein family protein